MTDPRRRALLAGRCPWCGAPPGDACTVVGFPTWRLHRLAHSARFAAAGVEERPGDNWTPDDPGPS